MSGTSPLSLLKELAQRIGLTLHMARLYTGAREALQMRDEFLGIAAHEIRGPVTAMRLALQTLRRGTGDARTDARLLDVIEREERRLTRFVEELLDVVRTRSGQLLFQFEDVDLAEVVNSVAARLSPELTQSGSDLVIDACGQFVGLWDRSRLDSLVTNLLSNAIKFGLGKPIEVTLRASQGRVTLVVRDHGLGIPPDKLATIFEPFERAVSARNYGGLGLGLFIAKTVAAGLGGSVAVQSKTNDGAVFSVELPVATAT